MKSETATVPLTPQDAEKVYRVEGDPDSDPARDGGPALLAAASPGQSTLEPAAAFLGHRSEIRSRESGRPAVWLGTISRQNLDRGFHLHYVPRPVPDHQHAHERAATAARKE